MLLAVSPLLPFAVWFFCPLIVQIVVSRLADEAYARVALLLLAMSSVFLPMQIPAEPQSGVEGLVSVSPWHLGQLG
jgi:hypothetical protein